MKIIRELNENYKISNPSDIYKYLKEFENEDREYLIIIGLDTKNTPVYREICSIGSLDSAIVHPREVFKKAVMLSCKSIIMAHNHPSNNNKPSKEDIHITNIIKKGGKLLGIKLLDHIIIVKDDYRSIIDLESLDDLEEVIQ